MPYHAKRISARKRYQETLPARLIDKEAHTVWKSPENAVGIRSPVPLHEFPS